MTKFLLHRVTTLLVKNDQSFKKLEVLISKKNVSKFFKTI